MNNKLKCPFCQQELHSASIDGGWLECWNCSYNEPSGHKLPQAIFMGTKELWQALIDTKKKLDLAITELKNVVEDDDFDIYMRQLSALTTLESINNITKGGKDA